MTATERTMERSPVTGAWRVSDIVGGYYMARTYYGYTKREALAMFNREASGVTR